MATKLNSNQGSASVPLAIHYSKQGSASVPLAILFITLICAFRSFAADTKISDMPAASSVSGADVVPIVQAGINKKASFTVQQDLWDARYVPLTRTLTIGGTALDLSANRSWTTNTILEGIGSTAQGDIVYRAAANWTRLPAGTSGFVLATQGTGANPFWKDPVNLGLVDNTAFAASWNAVTTIAPSKNAVYDWAHTFDTDDDGKVNVLDLAAGIPKTDSSGVLSLATLGTDYLDSTYIDDTVFGAGWDGDTTHAPSKNAVYDAINAIAVSDTAFAASWNGVTTIAPSKNAVYDWAHTFDTDDDGKVNVLDQSTGIANTDSGGVLQTPLAAPSGAIVGTTDTQTLSSKRTVPRVTSISSSATPTINTDNCDAVTITALATAITSMTTNLSGTPNNFDKLIIRFKDDGTGRSITWGASFASSQATLPTTTVANKVTSVGLQWDSVKSKWICLATDQEP